MWVCTKCGTEGGTPLPGRRQMDDRYAEGYCDSCSVANPPKPRKTPRPTSVLITAEAFDRDEFERRREVAILKALVAEFAAGGAHVQMTDPHVFQLVTLYDKHGFAGFDLPASVRADYEKIRDRDPVLAKKRKR